MAIDSEILELQRRIFGFWQEKEDIYYFGHIADEQLEGMVETTFKDKTVEKRQYSILKYAQGFELHVSNFAYTLRSLNEKEMLLIGPLPAGVLIHFKKLPNKITMSM